MPRGFVYILECADGSYYTGSTLNIDVRLVEHQEGRGANHTKNRLPIKLVYLEEYQRIDDAFYREKQIQGWSRAKKEALITNENGNLPELSECQNESHHKKVISTSLNHQKTSIIKDNLVAERSRSYSHGKLLITGEYLVLDGAKALAIPSKFGQSLQVRSHNTQEIVWKSIDHEGNIWLDAVFSLNLEHISTPNSTSQRLLEIFKQIRAMNPSMFERGLTMTSILEFPQEWGLGSSSTLINNLATWANIDPYLLLEKTFGGSGYDVACAQHKTPITYQLKKSERVIKSIKFLPEFSDHLYFVHLNQKQNSREGIAMYHSKKSTISKEIVKINNLTDQIIACKELDAFNTLIDNHEQIISKIIGLDPVKKRLFYDFEGSIKSLGAWGGDFVLVSSLNDPTTYFKDKGFKTIIPFKEMIL